MCAGNMYGLEARTTDTLAQCLHTGAHRAFDPHDGPDAHSHTAMSVARSAAGTAGAWPLAPRLRGAVPRLYTAKRYTAYAVRRTPENR